MSSPFALDWLGLAAVLPAAFVAAELSARRFLRRRCAAWVLEPYSMQVLELDRDTLPDLEPEVRIRVNRDGARGAPPPSPVAGERVLRVLVAGGSAAECYLLDQGTQWPGVLERRLAEQSAELGVSHVHVDNIARSLVHCDYVEWMLRVTLRRVPAVDVVILMVGASDLVAWLEQGAPSEWELDPMTPDQCFQQHDFGPFAWRVERLALRELAKRVQHRLRPAVVRRQQVGKSIAKNRTMRAAAKEIVRELPDPRPLVEHYAASLARTIATARSTGARVLVVRQPWLEREFTADEARRLWNFGRGRPYQGPVTTYFDIRVVHRLLAELDGVTERVATEAGVDVCEVRSRIPATFDSYYDTLHFTPRGAALVGELLAEAVLRRPATREDYRSERTAA
jgi:lysophospholipase L1-like esterase